MTSRTYYRANRKGTNLMVRVYSRGNQWFEQQTSLRGKHQPPTGYEYTIELADYDAAMNRIAALRSE
jgi:hypothetical protein